MMTSTEWDVIILGGGAAGLMCAIEAGKRGRSVLVLEHAKAIGKKILIAGGGRCNFTNIHASHAHFISRNPHFCKSALARFTPKDFVSLVEKHGIAYHEKKLGQLFCNESSRQITEMLEREWTYAGVEIRVNCSLENGVQSITHNDVHGDEHFKLCTNQGVFTCTALVIATGGPSIPKMGATGFGYDIARKFGLKIIPTKPALVPLTTDGSLRRFEALSGVSVDSIVECNGISFRENLLFTHRGLSGPAVLQISSYWEPQDVITINTAPNLDFEHFFSKYRSSKTTLSNALSTVLPKRFVEEFCRMYASTVAQKPFNTISQQEYVKIAELLQSWGITPSGTEGYAKAEVTVGGVDTNELSSKTMESKKQRGLYFIGEVVDVTGWLGGYNFQWAWASGVAAGQAL